MSKSNARRIVEQQRAADRRRTVTLWTSVAVVVVLAVAGMIGYSLMSGDEKTGATPAVAVDDGTAFALGAGPVAVDVYEDFLCPACLQVEQQSGPTLQQLARDNKITLRFHPVAILDRFSNGTEYSTRAAAASAAAAEAGRFVEFHDALYANQPAENSNGLTDDKIIELAGSVGISGDEFTAAVRDGTYRAWAARATEKFSERGFTGTPTIVVAGQNVEGPGQSLPSTELITNAIDQAAG